MKIIITECNTKNSIAIQKELSKNLGYELIAVSNEKPLISKLYNYCKYYFKGSLIDAVENFKPDLIIPVGGKSVEICNRNFRSLCLIPSKEALKIAFNKDKLVFLNKIKGVNYPEASILKNISHLKKAVYKHDLVIKPRNESQIKFDPIYLSINDNDFNKKINVIENYFKNNIELIVQKKVSGVGRGFFCIARNGQIYTFYMHERIREIPLTGGSSTAAKSIYCKQMKQISFEIVKDLNWSGPLMIEYKYDKSLDKYFLIELNPKFWGSLELSYFIGLNFGKKLIELFTLKESNSIIKEYDYQVNKKFYWILDGDLVNIFKIKKFKLIFNYFNKSSSNNMFENIFVDIIKLSWTIKKIIYK